ncbi:glycerophosphodiester phosphodiesterase family protein [Sphingobacterium bambusae]|uniref:Glycerophosphodiester phosphodiesterase family protein n=1 Tax=Sphingobacterium bambusae TaxID=662858 RepID=A0ABW6BL02_9SPHI|nr:glycerophosphodiester phosphodiesterase family protein [Sphingobacterium bambusae]WPL50915.1 glycerophosphodiester phosphodiesterase family protein [Sphingobacterium bambusae]
MNYRLFSLLTGLLIAIACKGQISANYGRPISSLTAFKKSNQVMVVAHRGDWRNAPENSVWAVKLAIVKGIDMVEIDLAMTKDSVLVLMHDKLIDRTTTGKGRAADYTWEELQHFRLRDGLGIATQMSIPRLEDILELTKGKTLLNLDKGYDYIQLVYPMLKSRNMLDEVLFKGAAPYEKVRDDLGAMLDSIHYMPIIHLERGEGVQEIANFTAAAKPFGFEFTVGDDESNMIDFKMLRSAGYQVWVNSLWPKHNAGHQDDLALENSRIYDWYLNNGVNIIQTDRPELLIDYLKSKRDNIN